MSYDNIDTSYNISKIDDSVTRIISRRDVFKAQEEQAMAASLARQKARDEAARQKVLDMAAALNNSRQIMYDKIIQHGNDMAKMAKLYEMSEIFIENMEKILRIDMELVNALEDLDKERKNTYFSDDFSAKMDAIADDSTIIYLKNAEIYKVYAASASNELFDHMRTNFKIQPIYEVIRDQHPQKLVIVVDEPDYERLKNVEKNLTEFIKQNKCVSHDADPDIRILGNKNKTEFLVTNVIFNNLMEKTVFTEKFVCYMSKKEKEISEKIQLQPEASGVPGIKYYDVPTNKINRRDGRINDDLTLLISKYPTSNIVLNVTYNINNSINNTGNGTIKNKTIAKVIINSGPPTKKDIRAFYTYLYNTKPDWYKEDMYVDFKHIEKFYKMFFPGKSYNSSQISKQLNQIFLNSKRSKGTTYKMLVSFDKLKELTE